MAVEIPEHLQRCRVCGLRFHDGFFPWGESGKYPSHEICDCCGAEFGIEDDNPRAARSFRQRWIEIGTPWQNEVLRPPGWSLAEQLGPPPAREFEVCRVCGRFDSAREPWPEGRWPSHEICDCCGTEWGYQDVNPAAAGRQRRRWIESGSEWHRAEAKPTDWDLEAQLAQIPEKWR